jgi:hypothetical protein
MPLPMGIGLNASTGITHPYFYLKGDNWEVGASLPSSLRVGLGDSVSIELDTDKPYNHYKEHIKKYPPKKSINNKNQKSKRI